MKEVKLLWTAPSSTGAPVELGLSCGTSGTQNEIQVVHFAMVAQQAQPPPMKKEAEEGSELDHAGDQNQRVPSPSPSPSPSPPPSPSDFVTQYTGVNGDGKTSTFERILAQLFVLVTVLGALMVLVTLGKKHNEPRAPAKAKPTDGKTRTVNRSEQVRSSSLGIRGWAEWVAPRPPVEPRRPSDQFVWHDGVFQRRLEEFGLEEFDCGAEGDCQFRAAAFGIWGNEERHGEVRGKAMRVRTHQ